MAAELRFGDLALCGSSRAGDRTWFRVDPPGLALDVGRGALELTGVSRLFVSHGHLDHCLGVPFLLSYRSREGVETEIFCPAPAVDDLRRLIAAAEALEGARYRYRLAGLEPGQRVAVGREHRMEAFATDHSVPTLGYHLERSKRVLRAELRDLPAAVLVERKSRGERVDEERWELQVSYCGDTGPGLLEREARLFEARVLVLECTFVGARHRQRGGRYKHIHLEDLVQWATRFQNEAIVLHHLSHRFDPAELRRAVDERLPTLAARVHCVGERR